MKATTKTITKKQTTYDFESIRILKSRREELGLSQSDLAGMSKVSKMYISDFERGVRPLPEHFVRFFKAVLKLGKKFELAWQKDCKKYKALKFKANKERLKAREKFLKETFWRTPSGAIKVRHPEAIQEALGNKFDNKNEWKKTITYQ